jgi:hypothetical protein
VGNLTDVKLGKLTIGQVEKATGSPFSDYYSAFIFNADGTRESLGGCGGCCAGIRARDTVLKAYHARHAKALQGKGHPAFKSTGFVTRHGVLHLFADADDLRAFMDEIGRDWGMIAWIESVEFHPKGTRNITKEQSK